MIISEKDRADVTNLPYKAHEHVVKDGKTTLITDAGDVAIEIFGYHNMQNLSCAKAILKRIGITDERFYTHIKTFKGAAKRMEIVGENNDSIIYSDFAHAPSKLLATTLAIKDQFPNRFLVSCLELHTFSSLNKDFIDQYEGTFNNSDEAIIYIDPKAATKKGLDQLTENDLREAFKRNDILLFNDKSKLEQHLYNKDWKNKNLILMSSGNFGGLDFKALKGQILQ